MNHRSGRKQLAACNNSSYLAVRLLQGVILGVAKPLKLQLGSSKLDDIVAESRLELHFEAKECMIEMKSF